MAKRPRAQVSRRRTLARASTSAAAAALVRIKAPSILRAFRLRPWRPAPPAVSLRRVLVAALFAVLTLVGTVPPVRQATSDAVSAVVMYAALPFAPKVLRLEQLPESSRILAADGSELASLSEERRRSIRLSDVPLHVRHAVLAAEDANFYQHSGVDPQAIVRALVHNITTDSVHGASTITMQLAKLNYLGTDRNVDRKVREVSYAARLEREFSKDELLERYLNQVYFGEGAYGIAAAADTFFGTRPSRLTLAQAATLAGMIRAPRELNPRVNPSAVVNRRNQVLRLMRIQGWLDSSQLSNATAEPLDVLEEPDRPANEEIAHFVQYVNREALTIHALGDSLKQRSVALRTGGYTIETTLDSQLLKAAIKAARLVLGAPRRPSAALAAVEPGDGGIRLLLGGLQPDNFDAASQGSRSAGSALYPFVLLAALRDRDAWNRAGLDPVIGVCRTNGRLASECPTDLSRLRLFHDALMQKRASDLSRLAREVGRTAIERVLRSFGISYGSCATDHIGVPMGVAPLDVAAAYAALSADGRYARPYAIARITDRHGRVVYRHQPQTNQVVKATDARVVTEVLRRSAGRLSAPGMSIGQPFGVPMAMTSSPTDAWLVGSIRGRATAVWVGHPHGAKPLLRTRGEAFAEEASLPAWIFGIAARSLAESTSGWLRPVVRQRLAPWLLSSWDPPSSGPKEHRPPLTLAFSSTTAAATDPVSLRAKVVNALKRSTAQLSGAAVVVEGLGVVVDLNGRRPLPPGSTQKLYTAAAALLELGPRWRMRTEVRRTGTLLPGGLLAGDLVLVASGDPTLVTADLRRLASTVAASGIRRVMGSLRIDDTHYDRARRGTGWRAEYVPTHSGPLSAFVVQGNRWRCDPAYAANPAASNGQRFRAALTKAGVTIERPIRLGPAPEPGQLVAVHESPPLSTLVQSMLKRSDNFIAELLLKELGAAIGRPTSEGGLEVVARWARRFGMPPGNAVDGSGLSPLDRQTPLHEVNWLMNVEKTPVGRLIRSSLPVGCKEGTLQARLCGSPAAGRVFAKTGTLRGTVTLAGYTTSASGRSVWFAFMLSGVRSIVQARGAADRATVALATFEG